MKFEITKQAKKKAKKNRIRNEQKWKVFSVIQNIALLISLGSIVLLVIGIKDQDYSKIAIAGILLAVFLIVFIVMKSVIANMSSHWIEDRINEKMWIDDGWLHHFFQTSFAAGLNSWSADETGYLMEIDIATIFDAKYDPKSKRIEFKAYGNGFHYSDVSRKCIDKQWKLNGYCGMYYDYYVPSLYEELLKRGVKFETCTIHFKLTDGRI